MRSCRQSDGQNVKLVASDGATVLVESDGIVDDVCLMDGCLDLMICLQSAQFVEVCGIATRNNSMRAKTSTNLDGTFGMGQKCCLFAFLIVVVQDPCRCSSSMSSSNPMDLDRVMVIVSL